MEFFDRNFWSVMTLMALFCTAYGAFMYSTTNTHAHRAALAWISKELSLVDYNYQANLRACLRNLDKDLNFCQSENFLANMRNKVKLINDAEADLLTSRQQLSLLDTLLGTHTKQHHVRKITKTRTVRDIVNIATQHMSGGDPRVAISALFS